MTFFKNKNTYVISSTNVTLIIDKYDTYLLCEHT